MQNSFSNAQPAARFGLESELGVQWFSSAKDAALEAAHQLRFLAWQIADDIARQKTEGFWSSLLVSGFAP